MQSAATYPEKARYQAELAALLQELVNAAPGNAELKAYAANAYGNLAWYHLFAREFKQAEEAARSAVALSPEAEWVHTNLALALLYQGRYADAEAIYQKYKGKPYDKKRGWTEVFLADLDELEAAGIKHDDAARVRAMLKK